MSVSPALIERVLCYGICNSDKERQTINAFHVRFQASASKKLRVALRSGPTGCSETSVRNCHYWVRNNSEERSSQPSMFIPPYVYKVCMYVCMYVCMHACMYVCVYVCVYVC